MGPPWQTQPGSGRVWRRVAAVKVAGMARTIYDPADQVEAWAEHAKKRTVFWENRVAVEKRPDLVMLGTGCFTAHREAAEWLSRYADGVRRLETCLDAKPLPVQDLLAAQRDVAETHEEATHLRQIAADAEAAWFAANTLLEVSGELWHRDGIVEPAAYELYKVDNPWRRHSVVAAVETGWNAAGRPGECPKVDTRYA